MCESGTSFLRVHIVNKLYHPLKGLEQNIEFKCLGILNMLFFSDELFSLLFPTGFG
jgi:hypothetical protein